MQRTFAPRRQNTPDPIEQPGQFLRLFAIFFAEPRLGGSDVGFKEELLNGFDRNGQEC